MTLEPLYYISTGEVAFKYAYKERAEVKWCECVAYDAWLDFKHLCRLERYKEAMNLIKRYIKEAK